MPNNVRSFPHLCKLYENAGREFAGRDWDRMTKEKNTLIQSKETETVAKTERRNRIEKMGRSLG